MHKMGKRKLLILVPILFLIITALLLFHREKAHFNYLDFFTGKVEVLKQDNKAEPAEIKKKLFLSDRVKTYEQSKAYIQFGEDHLIEVNQNTELEMVTLPVKISSSDEETTLNLIMGKIFVNAGKLTAKGKLNIMSGMVIIAVRGTIFSVEREVDILKLEVKEGNVSITPGGGVEETILTTGEKAAISGSETKKEKMNSYDPAFEDIGRLRPIINIESASEEYIKNYFSKKSVQDNKNLSKKDESDKSAITPADNRNKQKITEPDKTPGVTRLNINTLTANGVENKEAVDISKIIYSRLVSSKSKEKVIYRIVDGNSKSANRQLTGRVSRLGSVKIVFVNVLDVESGKVLFTQTVKVNDNDPIQPVLEGMADKIVSTGEIW